MPEKQSNAKEPSLARKGEPKQKTDQDLEIPVPEKREFLDALKKAVKPGSSRSSREKRPSSRDQ